MARPRIAKGQREERPTASEQIAMKNGMEDPDEFFETAASPGKENKTGDASTRARFSVGSISSASTFRTQDQEKAKRIKKQFSSPSDVSRVSTAPPSEKKIETARWAAKGSEGNVENIEERDEEFPVPQDTVEESFEDADDDLMPPPPPQSPVTFEEPTQTDVDFPTQFDDDADDEDNEGNGFDMANNDVEEEDQQQEEHQEALVEKKQKKSKKIPPIAAAEETSDSEPEVAVRTKKEKKKKNRKNVTFSPKGMQSGPTQFDELSLGGLVGSPAGEGLRRSRRTRIQPLAYWKNERPILGPNEFDEDLAQHGLMTMPEVKGYYKAQPTPYKKRKPLPARIVSDTKQHKKSKISEFDTNDLLQENPSTKPFDTRKLLKKYQYCDGEEANLWDEVFERADPDMKVIAYRENMVERDLPPSKDRPKSDGQVVGRAAQAFNIMNDEADFLPGYIMGHLTLPPKAIKDPESVGPCAQTFTVVACQPGSLEVAYSRPDEETGDMNPKTAQRFLLGPHDLFRIPPGNCYRLQNHSKYTDCLLTWTIIRPASVQDPSVASRSTPASR